MFFVIIYTLNFANIAIQCIIAEFLIWVKKTHKNFWNHYKNSDLILSTHNFFNMIKLVIVNLLLEFTGGYMKGWITMFWNISWRRKKTFVNNRNYLVNL